MAQKYYLLNGKNGKGEALDLLVDGELKRDFIDISSLDLKTLDIPINKAKDTLKKYNEDKDLDGTFYAALYPFKKVETKTFIPAFGIENEELEYYLNNLRYFAEQREWNIKNRKSKDFNKDAKYDRYVEVLLYYLLKNQNQRVVRPDSSVGSVLKDELKEGYRAMSYKSPEEYIRYRRKLKSLLDHYTQLRILTLEYISSQSDYKIPTRSALSRFSKYENYGMEPTEGNKSDKQIKYYQYTLDDFGL